MIHGGDHVMTPHWQGFLLATLVAIPVCQAEPVADEKRGPVSVPCDPDGHFVELNRLLGPAAGRP